MSDRQEELTEGTLQAYEAPLLWIVVPCYNEEEVLPETARRLLDKIESLVSRGEVDPASRILFVDDGSRDATWKLITELHEGGTLFGNLDVRPGLFCGLTLAHNAGHQNALYAGLMQALDAGCDCAISLDADLQDDIDAIDEMLQRYAEGCEIVYGVRNNRDTDTAFKRGTAEAFYSFMKVLGVEMVSDSADYRLMGARALAALKDYRETNLFLRGIVPALGFTTGRVYYRRAERFAGESKYPLKKMVAFALEGITSFSIAPIRAVMLLGLLSVVFSLIMVMYALVSLARGTVVPGWTSLMVSIWFVGGLIMTSLGVVELVESAYGRTLEGRTMLAKLGRLTCVVVGVALAMALGGFLTRGLKVQLDESRQFGAEHFLMMGLNPELRGDYSQSDVNFSKSFATREERRAADLSVARDRLAELGPAGLAGLLLDKTLINFNDGTFAWGQEGRFFDEGPHGDDVLAPLTRSLYYEDGAHYFAFVTYEHLIWLMTLLLCTLSLLRSCLPRRTSGDADEPRQPSREQRYLVTYMALVLTMLSCFELVFEARARYLYAFSTLFVMLAAMARERQRTV